MKPINNMCFTSQCIFAVENSKLESGGNTWNYKSQISVYQNTEHIII